MGARRKLLFLLMLSAATLLPSSGNGQVGAAQLTLTVNHIASNGNYVSTETVGIKSVPSKQFELGRQLSHLASEQQLIELCKHSSTAARVYAFAALGNTNKAIQKKIYKTTLVSDHSSIQQI